VNIIACRFCLVEATAVARVGVYRCGPSSGNTHQRPYDPA
jgi:hypothetical protein